jgi:pimeloyl-ACP methyl ester carboxylesterase
MIRLALPCLVLVLSALPAAAQDLREWRQRWEQTSDSWVRRAMLGELDAADRKQRAQLLDVLESGEWYLREGVIDVLARLDDPQTLAKLERIRDPEVQEGLAHAWARSGDRDRVPAIVKLLDARAWRVQREAAAALGGVPDLRAIEGLIAAWEGEPAFLVAQRIRTSLIRLTHQRDLGRQAQDWRGWWDAVGEGFEVPAEPLSEDEALAGEEIAREGATRLRLQTRGRGRPLLVLPEYGYEHLYLEGALGDLEDAHQILYLKLPGAADFVDPPLQPAPDLPDPYYPLARITDALDALHGELVAEGTIQDVPFAIVAHGLSCWIAMTYAARHPDRVRAMVLIAPYSSGEAWDAGRIRAEAKGLEGGDLELAHFAQSQLYGGYEAQSPEEEEALERKELSAYWADPRDLEIGRVYGPILEKTEGDDVYEMRRITRPMGTVVIPEFEQAALPNTPTPTLVIHGERALRTSLEDVQAVAAHYGKHGKVARLKRSARMPFYEEHEAFMKTVRAFLE